MKKALNLIRLAIKYGGFVLVIVDVLQYAVTRFESLGKEKEPEKIKE